MPLPCAGGLYRKNNMIEYSFEQLINIDQLRHLLEAHNSLSGMAYGLYDSNENHIVSVGWQDICSRFHRVHPVCSERCHESKTYFQANLHESGDGFLEYRCRNGIIDAAMPILIEERHLATFYIGQFFYADDPPDRAYFLDQAREFGFDPDEYLEALERVPVLNREHVRANVKFLHSMVRCMAESGLKSFQLGLKLANETEQYRQIEEWHVIFGFTLDQMHEAAFVIDDNGRFHYVNQEACRSLGYSRNELTGMTVPDIDPDFTNEMVLQNVKLLHEDGPQTFETRHRTIDGRIFPVEITASLFEHNGVSYHLSLARNITERKRAEEQALRSREIFLDTLLDTVPVPIYYKDRQARYLGFNRAFEEFFGAKKEQLTGKTVFDISPPELAEIYSRHDSALFAQGGSQRYESSVRNARDELRNVVFNKAVFTDHDGKPCGMIGTIADITEHKMAEQQLREALEFSEGVINAIPDLLFEVNRDGRHLNAWTQKPELLAVPKEILLGKTVHDVLSPEAASIAMAGIREAEEIGFSFGNILRIDLPQGTHWFEQSLSRIPGGDPSDVRFLVLSRDITQRIRTEIALKESEARYRHSSNLLTSILESATSVGVYALDREYRYFAFNRRHQQGMNYLWGGDIAVGMSLLDVVASDEYREKIRKVFDEVLTGRSLSAEARFVIMRDDRKVSEYYENHGSPIFNDEGDVVGLTFFAINITERKRMEEMLRRREREFRTLVENSPDIIVRYGHDLRRQYVNPAFAALIEGGTAALLGRTPSEYPAHPDAAIFERKLEKVFASGRTLEYEVNWMNWNGSEICNLFILTPEFGENGAVESVLAVGRDITELRRSSNILLEKQQRLAELAIELSMAEEQERRRIATSLHDIIGQDLALARIKLGLLSKKLHANQDRELLENAHKLMNRVIKGVRSLTHLIHPPILQSSGLEAATQWLARQMGEEYGLAVELRDDHREKPISREIQTHLYFAVRELLINVVKHAGTNRASVSLFRENGVYHIVVEDWGTGFNANNGIDKKAEFDGFGLFNIRRRTMYFGGILEIDSSPSNGTRVTIKLPLESDEN